MGTRSATPSRASFTFHQADIETRNSASRSLIRRLGAIARCWHPACGFPHGQEALESAMKRFDNSEKNQESRIRRLARRHGYFVRKSRQWKHVPHLDNHGEYMLLDTDSGIPVHGWRFDATLDDIAEFFSVSPPAQVAQSTSASP
jgi:hypothetical protein